MLKCGSTYVRSVYIVGSAISGEFIKGFSDIDFLVFISKDEYCFVRKGLISMVIIPHPALTGNLIFEGLVVRKPLNISTYAFLLSPKKLIYGEDITKYLKPTRPNQAEYRDWVTIRYFGAYLGLTLNDWRRVCKNYIKLLWAKLLMTGYTVRFSLHEIIYEALRHDIIGNEEFYELIDCLSHGGDEHIAKKYFDKIENEFINGAGGGIRTRAPRKG